VSRSAALTGLSSVTLCALVGACGSDASSERPGIAVKATNNTCEVEQTSFDAGKITFNVKNDGRIAHDFQIQGAKSKILTTGQSDTFDVALTQGAKAYICTLTGHADAGMKGTLGVGVTVGGGGGGGTVGKPKTTLRVTLSEFKIKITNLKGKKVTSVKAGLTRFLVKNSGKITHNFAIGGKSTPLLKRGKSATLNVTLKKGTKTFLCSVPGHPQAGMKGKLKVT